MRGLGNEVRLRAEYVWLKKGLREVILADAERR